MEPEEENEISELQRSLRLSHKVMYDTTPMFPPKPLPGCIKLVTVSDIIDSIEALRKAHVVDMVVSATPADSDLTLVSTKNRMAQYDIITIDSTSTYDE